MNDTGNAQDPTSTLSDSPPVPPPGEERTLRRSDEGRMLTGVCAGLGRYSGIDPVVFRVGFAVLVLGSGIGIMLYVAAFLLMREANGGPGYLEQWTRRDFDSETVLALLAGVLAFGLIINVSSDGIGTGTVVVGTLFAIALLAAHSRGVDLLAVARSLPDRLRGRRPHPPARPADSPFPAFFPTPERPPGASPFPGGPPTTAPQAPAWPYPGAPGAPGASTMPTAPDAPGAPAFSGVPGASAHPAEESHPATRQRTEVLTGAHETPPPPTSPPGAPPTGTPGTPPTGTSIGTPAAGAPDDGPPTGGGPAEPYRTGGRSFDSSGEPFSPYGPYRPLDPARRQPHSPYDLPGYGRPVETPPRAKRPRSFVGGVTMFLAMIVGGIVVAIQSTSGSVNMTVVGGAVLVTIGTGLLVATWFGRGAALVAAGTLISIALIAGSTLTGMPKKFGDYRWEPTNLSEVISNYTVGIGEGTLNLSELPLPPGSRTVFEASVSVGEIRVILPPTARVEVNGYTKLGDVKIDHSVKGGADVKHNKILEPEVPPKGDAATIVLNVKAGIGDVEVRRAA